MTSSPRRTDHRLAKRGEWRCSRMCWVIQHFNARGWVRGQGCTPLTLLRILGWPSPPARGDGASNYAELAVCPRATSAEAYDAARLWLNPGYKRSLLTHRD